MEKLFDVKIKRNCLEPYQIIYIARFYYNIFQRDTYQDRYNPSMQITECFFCVEI